VKLSIYLYIYSLKENLSIHDQYVLIIYASIYFWIQIDVYIMRHACIIYVYICVPATSSCGGNRPAMRTDERTYIYAYIYLHIYVPLRPSTPSQVRRRRSVSRRAIRPAVLQFHMASLSLNYICMIMMAYIDTDANEKM
jgi:hypothetical protein